MKNRTTKKNVTRKIIILVLVCMLLALITLGATFWYGVKHPQALFNSDGNASGFIKLLSSEQKSLDDIVTIDEDDALYSKRLTMLERNADTSYMAGKTNILLLGIDENQEREGWGYFRTDTIIVLNIDFEKNTAAMLSIPRDSLVWITGYGGKARINKAFAEGGGYRGHGFENAIDTVSKMLGGLKIDSYVCVDMEVLKDIVDAIGGVDYYVDHVIDTSDAHLEVGQQHLWGSQVLAYVRQRKGQSDIVRIDRQQRMLQAIFTKLKDSKKLVLIPQLYTSVKDDMYTDLTVAQIAALARWAMDFDLDDLTRETVNGKGVYIGNGSYWAVDQYDLEDTIEDMFGLSVSLSKSNDASVILPAAERFNTWQATALEQGTTTGAYIYANRKYCEGDEYSTYINILSQLETLANSVSLTDPGARADEIKAAVVSFQSYCASLEATLRARIGDGSSPTTQPTQPGSTTTPAPTDTPPDPTSAPEPTAAPPAPTDPPDTGDTGDTSGTSGNSTPVPSA
ncbi:MAG: LCP family protein [Eubacteriales bacterium]